MVLAYACWPAIKTDIPCVIFIGIGISGWQTTHGHETDTFLPRITPVSLLSLFFIMSLFYSFTNKNPSIDRKIKSLLFRDMSGSMLDLGCPDLGLTPSAQPLTRTTGPFKRASIASKTTSDLSAALGPTSPVRAKLRLPISLSR